MSDSTDLAAEISATFARDAALYEVISKHGIRPVVFTVTKEEAAALAGRLAEQFETPFVQCRFTPLLDAKGMEELRERERHAPLFRAIRQSGKG